MKTRPAAPSASAGSVASGTPGRPGLPIPVATSPTMLTPYVESPSAVDAAIPTTSTMSAPGMRGEMTRSRKIAASETSPTPSVYGSVSPIPAMIPWTWSGTDPDVDGIPRILGIWPTMIVSATPKMNPVMTDLERKSEMNPSRAMPPARRTTPTMSASAAVSAR